MGPLRSPLRPCSMSVVIAFCIAGLGAGIVGCDDGGGTRPGSTDFAIHVVVTDQGGQAVSGLRAGLSPALPESLLLVHPPADRTRDLLPPETFDLTVRDVAGAIVRGEAGVPFGSWDGRDDEGRSVHDGWYLEQWVATDSAGAAAADTIERPTLYYSGADPDAYLAGVTGDDGSFTVTDRTFVPAFWNPAPVPIPGADGETGEFIELTPQTWLRLRDDRGAEQWAEFIAEDGRQTLRVIWTPFRVELRVTDGVGAPVPGLYVVVMPALPDWVWPWDPNKVQVSLRFTMPTRAHVLFRILDIRRDPIRTLIDSVLPAGVHEAYWDGRNAAGDLAPSGWYAADLRIRDTRTDSLLYDGWRALLTIDPDTTHAVAVTDADGIAVLVDRRLVPGFWDLDPITATDESGTVIGEFTLTPATWIRLVDGEGRQQWWTGGLVDGPQTIPITWEPAESGRRSPAPVPPPASCAAP